ncbi:hypothetical protein BJ165DRAFT_1510710 [Panaeolus papilionaceus]|nr:hypothetical protein BJ165DRAFT_1510710 [Panaeolus papilionaceus]
MTLTSFYIYRIVSLGAFILPSYAYTITTKTLTDRPTVGDNLFYEIVLESSDTITIVDIHLADGSRGNSSLVFGSSDLNKPTDARAGFPIPAVPPGSSYTVRILAANNKRRLADSASFEIFARGASSPTSLGPTTLPSSGPTSTPSQSHTNTPGDNAQASTKKSTPVGPIIGGVLGGLLAIVLILLALLLMGRRKKKKRMSYYESNNKPRPITPPPLGEVKPFVVNHPELPSSTDADSTTNLSTITAATGNRTAMGEKARLAQAQARSRSNRDIRSLQTTNASPSSPVPSSSRADELRIERDRLNRMIADLENRTISSPSTLGGMSTFTFVSSSAQSGSSSGDSRDHQLAEQVAALREQIQRMEARQAQQPTSPQNFSSATSNTGYTDYEPPPGYEPPPSSTTSPTAVASPDASQPRPSDLDRKTPL